MFPSLDCLQPWSWGVLPPATGPNRPQPRSTSISGLHLAAGQTKTYTNMPPVRSGSPEAACVFPKVSTHQAWSGPEETIPFTPKLMCFLQLLSIMSNNSFVPTDYTTTEKVVVIEARITANVSSNIKPNKATWMNSIALFVWKFVNFTAGVLGFWWQRGKFISTLMKSSPLWGRLAVLLTLSVQQLTKM